MRDTIGRDGQSYDANDGDVALGRDSNGDVAPGTGKDEGLAARRIGRDSRHRPARRFALATALTLAAVAVAVAAGWNSATTPQASLPTLPPALPASSTVAGSADAVRRIVRPVAASAAYPSTSCGRRLCASRPRSQDPVSYPRAVIGANVPMPRFGPGVHLRDPLRYAANDPRYARQPLPDDEPAVAIAPDGTVWVAALHLHHGTALWRGRFAARTPLFVGQPDHGIGGDDIALAVARPPGAAVTSLPRQALTTADAADAADAATAATTASATARVPVAPANLYLASMVAGSGAIAATACPGGAVAGNFAACRFYPALDAAPHDRPWLASDGRATLYLSYTRQTALLTGGVTVRRSTDGGATWTQAGSPTAAVATGTRGWAGNLAVDPHRGALYQILEMTAPGHDDGPFNRMVVATSHDGGATWRDVTVYQGSPDADDANMWPALAVDADGHIYAAWSDGHHVLMSSSSDGAAAWSAAARVDTPADGLRTSVLPALAAGAAGQVVLAWYGSTAADRLSTAAAWRVVFAASRDGGRRFAQTFATGVIHRGPVCTKGASCPYTQRQLLDLLGVALDPRSGRAAIVYARSTDFGDYRACRAAANCPQVYYVEQMAAQADHFSTRISSSSRSNGLAR